MVDKKRAEDLAAELDRYIYQLEFKRPFDPKKLHSLLSEISGLFKESAGEK